MWLRTRSRAVSSQCPACSNALDRGGGKGWGTWFGGRQTLRLGTILLQVGDADSLETARRWYEDHVGLQVVTEEPGESVFFAKDGGTTLGLHTGPRLEHPDRLTLYFEVADVDAVHQELRHKGVEFMEPPTDRNWGGRVAKTSDPVGHSVHLMTWIQVRTGLQSATQ